MVNSLECLSRGYEGDLGRTQDVPKHRVKHFNFQHFKTDAAACRAAAARGRLLTQYATRQNPPFLTQDQAILSNAGAGLVPRSL